MTVSVVTQEQITAANDMTNAYLEEYGLTGNSEVAIAMGAMQFIHGSPSTNYDDNRMKRIHATQTTGTVALVGTDGLPTSVDYGASRIPHEETYVMKQYMGVHSIIERDLAQLRDFIGSIVMDTAGIKDAFSRFKTSNIGQLFVDEINASMFSHVEGRLNTKLNAVTTDTIFSDEIAATSGAVINTNNIITGGFDETTPAALIKRSVAAVDYNGNKLKLTLPKVIFADAGTSYTKVLELMNPGQTINMSHKQIMDLFTTNQVLIVPFTATNVDKPAAGDYPSGYTQSGTAGDVHVFTGQLPLKLMSETSVARVRFKNFDSYGNGGVLVDYIYAWIWTSRNGYFYVVGA